MRSRPVLGCLLVALLLTAILPPWRVQAAEPHWIRIDSSHFSVITDADPAKAHEVAARFEQMRALFAQLLMRTRVNLSEPITIIAFKTPEEYAKVAPPRAGEGLGAGFFLPGDDQVYFVLNLSQDESWRAISYYFARVLLNYNYPPTQPWFDEGFAEYFASAHLGDQQMKIGEDPEAFSSSAGAPAARAKSFVEILKTANWQSVPELFASKGESVDRHTLFSAQSWVTMHYLITTDKLSAAGTYFGLVETEKLSVDEAIQKAFGMSSEQLGKAIQDYFHSLSESQNNPNAKQAPMPAPVAADQVGTSFHDIPDASVRALVAEMTLRVPERREQAHQELELLINDPKAETAIAHRALGWYYLEKKDFEKSSDELSSALALDVKDVWTHFYLALSKDRKAKASGQATQGLANMIQDLHIVLDWYPEFAEAYAMLAKAQLEGGGLRAATDSIRAAVKLAPRNQSYLLELAQVYMAGQNWDAATSLLNVLAGSPDPQIASAAKTQLQNLPYVKKYGVPPQQVAQQPQPAQTATPPAPKAPIKPAPQPEQQASDENAEEAPAEPQIDRRPVQYLKGNLRAVDCSQTPAAVLTISSGAKTIKLRTADYKSLTLIGADAFSCDWTNRAVSVNYKAGGKSDGDLVSLELR
jgi:tetratricopeptide (TPR) repeat protein